MAQHYRAGIARFINLRWIPPKIKLDKITPKVLQSGCPLKGRKIFEEVSVMKKKLLLAPEPGLTERNQLAPVAMTPSLTVRSMSM